ncbi:glycosyl transferase family 1 [Devosia soli]|uniref:Glycosyl transferase family 1 n=1 Tax=Devosia soli TaxID=361041 RepID=A0A0F5LF38_9HYPH|nr:glycosyltransferase family 4 protein [Devosia soli]KKB80915.1 glycosyl transferase family 1 [Devosia soli]
MTNTTTRRPAAFAIPGDATQKTGGYIYEWELLQGLRRNGRAVDHIELASGFPDPSPAETRTAIETMAALPADVPLIIDGLVFGSIDTAGLETVRAPIVAMIHHPLGLETGLSAERSAHLLGREADNLKLARAVLVPSPHTARILVGQFGVAEDKITIALPGFRPADPVKKLSTPPLILSVGLLAERKGHDVLVAAFGKLRDLEWQAQIVGKTHDAAVEARLRGQIEALGLGERVVLTGLLDDAEVIERYRAASIFALATRYEGYGIVLGEALLHGLPIVTCRTGAVPDTVPEGAGLLVPVDDAEAIAKALRMLLTDHDARQKMAEVSRQAGERLPSWDDTERIVSGVLDRVY